MQHLEAMRPLVADPAMQKILVWERYPLSLAARIAERSLTAEVALLDRDTDAAIAALQEATAIEDRIPYDEPPGWHSPTRHALGAALLDAGKAAEAEAVYRAELARNPQNGWSLIGLARSLRAQKRNDEAAEAEKAFRSTPGRTPTSSSRPRGSDRVWSARDRRAACGRQKTLTGSARNGEPLFSDADLERALDARRRRREARNRSLPKPVG